MRSRFVIPVVMVAVFTAYWWLRPRPQHLAEAYVSDRSVTLWSSAAQVKEPLATLRYGEKVTLLRRLGEQAHVRTAQGVTGWLDARLLIEPPLWARSAKLLEQARSMPVQARGRTKVPTNVHVEPGRTGARLYRFARGTPAEVLARAVVDLPIAPGERQAAAKDSGSKEPPEEESKPRGEDWLLVRGLASGPAATGGGNAGTEQGAKSVEVAGWVLGRFIELDLPRPVRDYTSSSGTRVTGWFELNRVSSGSAEMPQYLAVGVRGGEGQPCDFTMIRVYTWGARRARYETAYVESDLCGRLPVRVTRAASGEPEFHFSALAPTKPRAKGSAGPGTYEERVYRMRQTVVRRVRESLNPAAPPRR